MKVEQNGLEVAIIGISGRFPGSQTIEYFWNNLTKGLELTLVFPDSELQKSALESNGFKKTIKAGAVLDNIEMFDASFFGFNPRDAEIMDPQHRLFLECAWEALEDAAYDSEREERPIGVYAGVGASTYLLYNLFPNNLKESLGYFPILLASDKDYVPTRVSYKLNLKGPSVSVGTACSSSLVAVHLAYQSLLSGECDMALAAGVSVKAPQNEVTLCPDVGISPDGHCRAFDARAQGTIGGNGIGVVVLKRLEDAIADRDYIYAVIKGSAINNDGAIKVSYTAPSEEAQARVIRSAQIMAEVEPETITYIEAHGTGTTMGDPIEIAALTKAFQTAKKGYCAIGSVKTNLGHLDAAAGIAGLIKTVLALDKKWLPPSLNFETPNPQIDFENSPFYVNTKLSEWKANGTPRRAGVSSFGFGGTNAHVIVEEAPPVETSASRRSQKLLMLSAKTSSALETATASLVEHLKQHPDLNLADVTYTLQVGRRAFEHRRTVVCQDIEDAVSALQDPKRVLTSIQETSERPVAFMFTGLGTQYVNMAWELYQVEPTFQESVDRCCELLKPLLGLDLRDVLYPNQNQTDKGSQQPNPTESASPSGFDLRKMLGRGEQQVDEATQKLNQTCLTQPAIFVIEYALAQLWRSWGIHPVAMIGYSIGEYVAATLAGVLSLEDAITLVAKRAQMIQELPGGAMLAVPLSEEEVRPLLNENLSLSAINGPSMSVIAGSVDAVDELANQLSEKGLACRHLVTSHAFHSHMMEAIAESFAELVKTVSLQPPKIPYLSNVTGTWITADQATDPSYWTRHLCQPVRFADGIDQLWKQQNPILLEVGPGQTLSSLAMQCLGSPELADKVVLPSLRDSYNQQPDQHFLLNTLGQLWLSGVQIDWSGFYAHEHRYRIPLPTYPFERQRYWIDPPSSLLSGERFQPLSAASELWESMVEAGQRQAIEGIKGLDEQASKEHRLWLDRLCTAYMNQTLRRLEAFSNPSETYSFEELFEQCQIIPRYRELLARWLNVLVEQGHLHKDDEGRFTKLLPLSTNSVNALVEEVRLRSADLLDWIDIYQLYGENLPAIVTGEREPLEFHFSMKLQEQNDSVPNYPTQNYYKPILRSLTQQVVRSLPPNANLRVLEIGAGTGTATEELLPVLPSRATHYTFTDVGSLFLKAAKKKFHAYPFIEYGLLDIEQSPQEQGYSPHSFDIVIAFNVLHVARNIGETLDRVRSLLAPGGFLLLWEITEARLEADIMDGVLMNPIADAEGSRNMGNPFLSKEQWQEALTSHGFDKVAAFSEFEEFREHIILAQASSSAALQTPPAFTALIHQDDANQTPQVLLGKKPDLADWFYIPSWKRSMLPPFKSGFETSQSEGWLVFVDECGLGTQLVKRLEREGQNVITVRVGEQFCSESKSPTNGLGQRTYTLNPRQKDDYNALFKEIRALNLTPKRIVHLWSVTPHNHTELELEGDDKAQDLGFYSLLFLAQAIGEQILTDFIEIGIVSNNMQELTGEERLCPEKALVLGPCKVIPTEYPNIKCRSIDVAIPESESWQAEKLVDQLLVEFTTPSSDQVIAYRGNYRWVQSLEPVRLDGAVEEKSRLREGGVYLLTGGLGGVGLALAEYLAQTVKAKLILVGRSAFPNRDEWTQWLSTHDEQDSTSLKIRKVQNLEALGAEVLAISADVANFEEMSAAIAQANNQFGQIHGVIHAAAAPVGGMIQLKTPEAAAAAIAAKVRGTRVLDILFKNAKLDFFVLCSSRITFTPEAGFVDYVAENAFLDTFAHYHVSKHGTFTRAINWDTWSGLETAVSVEARYKTITRKDLTEGMMPEEGIEVFRRVLFNSSVPQIVVSTRDLLALTEAEQKVFPDALAKANSSKTGHQRPNLKNAYIAPSNELERKIAENFQEFLGIEQVGIHDSFFALGGDSLTGSVLINRLRSDFRIELPVVSFFEAPTVAELALVIEKILIEELEELTEEEAI